MVRSTGMVSVTGMVTGHTGATATPSDAEGHTVAV